MGVEMKEEKAAGERGKRSEKRSGSGEVGFGCIPPAPIIQWTPVLKL
jgi:hypothetical protein